MAVGNIENHVAAKHPAPLAAEVPLDSNIVVTTDGAVNILCFN